MRAQVTIDACCLLNLLATRREIQIVQALELHLLDTPQVSVEPLTMRDGHHLIASAIPEADRASDAEPVKELETILGQSFCMSASREGSLIHATLGSLDGVGRRPRNRSGLAA